MATLPSFEQLGMVTPQPAQGPLLSPDVAEETDKAGAQLGQSTARAGYDISRADYYEGNLQRGYAEANLKNGMVALQQEIQSDPTNYATASDRFQKGYQDLMAQQKETIDDPVQQQKFMANGLSTMALGQKQIDNFSHQASKADQLSKLDVMNTSLIQSSLQNPAMMGSNIQTMQNAIQATVQTGAMDQAHATLYGQQQMEKLAVARLKFMPPLQQVQVLQPMMDQAQGNVQQPDAQPANSNLPTTSDTAIPYVMNRFEGAHLVQNDNGHGPSRYGIVAADNGLTPDQVANLSPQQAMQLYKTNYWDKIGADDLPANMRLAAFDTAVQFGPDTAKGMIAQADGDPQKLLDIRAQAYQNLIKSNPAKYGGSAPAWDSRQQLLGQALTGQDKKNVSDWTQMLPAEKVPELYAQAQQGVRGDIAEQERAQRLQQEQVKQQQEQAMNGYMDRMDPSLPPDKQVTAQDIYKDQTLTFEQRDRLLNTMHTVAERGQQTDPQTFNTLFNRIHSDGPDKLTSGDDLNSYVGHGISFEDLSKLRTELDGKKTPDGQAISAQRTQTFATLKDMFLGKSEAFGIPDPDAQANYSHALRLTLDNEKKMKDAGNVSPADMYDATSPQWIGNVAKPLVKTIDQRVAALSGAKIVAPPAMESRVVGNVYQSPNGPMKWTGTGWLPATAPSPPGPPQVPLAQ